MKLLKRIVKNKKIFKQPPKDKAPPIWIRSIMVLTCTAVSFSHGSNDGQKGVGLVMMILIGIVPDYFALDMSKSPAVMKSNLMQIERIIQTIDTTKLENTEQISLTTINTKIDTLSGILSGSESFDQIKHEKHFEIRKDIILLYKTTDKFLSSVSDKNVLNSTDMATIKSSISSIKTNTEFAPWWVILMISLSLGVGTMIGWKRIVMTIGEKIGKTPMNYAQGATSQFIAASTISVSSMLGLPVSTTHVLSSGVAGTMVAESGRKNLQGKTMKNIGLAWVVTLPVTIVLSGSLFLLLRFIMG
jgi:PiT family inorganic phosphate transporter